MTIVSGNRQPENDSEKLFDQYLEEQGYDRLFEPTIKGKDKHPDFAVRHDRQNLLFEVKERRGNDQRSVTLRPEDGNSQGNELIEGVKFGYEACPLPTKGIRTKITDTGRQFKGFKEYSCSLVIYNAGDIDTLLHPYWIFAAMLGNPEVTVEVDDEGNPLWGTAKKVHLPGGKMVRDKTLEYQNTTINAIIILEQRALVTPEFDRVVDGAIADAEREAGRRLTGNERGEINITKFLENPPTVCKIVRVCVCEHPGARMPLPRTAFRGDYDERWAIVNGQVTRIFAGSKVHELVEYESNDLLPEMIAISDQIALSTKE